MNFVLDQWFHIPKEAIVYPEFDLHMRANMLELYSFELCTSKMVIFRENKSL